jgi:phosphoribosylanthranilate isomerase
MRARSGFAVKICGLSTPETLDAALEAGADMIGLVFHPKSPRFVEDDLAARLAGQARGRAAILALVVDMDDARLEAIRDAVAPDGWQLHGRESVDRVRAIRARFGLPVMKAIGWAAGDGAERAEALAFGSAADRLLLDARPPADAAYPGGHGQPFDWATLAVLARGDTGGHPVPFMLSGGLHPGNVAGAIRTVRGLGCALAGVDVSTGVESRRGVKEPGLIRDFIAAARAADAGTNAV